MWPAVAAQILGHFLQHQPEGLDGNLALVTMQDLHETRHVCALEIVRQIHVHVEIGHRLLFAARPILDLHRMINVLDAHFVDGYLARVGVSLDILHGLKLRLFGGDSGVHIHEF